VHLIQLLLPTFDNSGEPFPRDVFDAVSHELTEKFGGLTVYMRAPAEGHWKFGPKELSRDDIVIYEVMAVDLDTVWWRGYRQRLESSFRQVQVIVRAHMIQLL
jgi:hypothetical protein